MSALSGDVSALESEMVETAKWLFTHHGRYGRDSVIPGRHDVFVIGNPGDGYDIAIRIDGSYTDKILAEDVADYWRKILASFTERLRRHEKCDD